MKPEPSISFEPVSQVHFPMLHAWLSQPHVRQWWDNPDKELESIRSHFEIDDGTEGFVIFFRSEPVGYIQSWRPGAHDEEPWQKEMPRDTVGIDLFIGDEDMIGKGFGPQIIRVFASRLFDEGAPRLIIDPDAQNKPAIRAYEKAGFKPFSRHDNTKGGTLLMELTREEFQRIS